MGHRADEIIEEFLSRLRNDFRLSKVVLFGSRARDDSLATSDYDLIIVSPNFEGIPFVKRLPLVYAHWTFDVPLEALCYTPAEFDKKRRQIGIVSHALKEGIEVYAA